MSFFIILVLIVGFVMSLWDIKGLNIGGYIGFKNYEKLFKDAGFFNAVINSFKLAVVCLATQIPVSFILANRLNAIPYKKIQGLLQAAFFVPYLMMTVVIGFLFRMLFSGDPDFMNWLFGLLFLPHNFKWMLDRNNEFFMIVFVSFWQNIGFQSAYFLANLQSVNPDLYESAKMDGASSLQIFFKIKLPMMRPALNFIIVTSAIASLMLFDLVFMLFQYPYGPQKTGITIMSYTYVKVLLNPKQDIGLLCATGLIAFIIILAVSLLEIKALGLGKAHDE